MEDKIEVGEYGRTDEGNIFEFGGYFKSGNIDSMTDKDGILYGNQQKCCKKHSKNIMELIEVSDYVNGYKVLAIEKHFQVQPYRISIMVYKTKDAEFWISLEEETIEDIVTKEQFESVKYKV